MRLDGAKELVAPAEGLRESTESWADLLRHCRRRGMRETELAVGDGAMGLSAQDRRRAITGAQLIALVRSGIRSGSGVLVEREETAAAWSNAT